MNEADYLGEGFTVEPAGAEEERKAGVERRMKAYMEAIEAIRAAQRVGSVDKDKLAALVLRAKGSRSMRKFAEDMEVNASSVSRIINGKVTEISDTLLAKISIHADPESNVTLDELMSAQGMVKKEDVVNLPARYERECRQIVADELLNHGYSITEMNSEMYRKDLQFDFMIRTDAMEKGNGIWLFETKMFTQYSRLPVGIGRTAIWIDRAMATYYRGEIAGRISLLVDHKAIFDQMKKRLETYEIEDEISVILISVPEGRIIEEYVAPLKSGVAKKIF